MRKIIFVLAMVLVSAGAQAGGSRGLSLTVSDSKAVQDSAKTVEPASAVNTPRAPNSGAPNSGAPKSANAASGEATGSTGASERQKFAETECVARVKEADSIMQTGTPWFAKYGLTMEDLHGIRTTEGWHARYGGGTASKTGAGPVDPNAVY